MSVEGAASFEVLVGGAPCHEYAHDGKTYVEMDLQHATSYDCKYVDDTPHGTVRGERVARHAVRGARAQREWRRDLARTASVVDSKRGRALFSSLHKETGL